MLVIGGGGDQCGMMQVIWSQNTLHIITTSKLKGLEGEKMQPKYKAATVMGLLRASKWASS